MHPVAIDLAIAKPSLFQRKIVQQVQSFFFIRYEGRYTKVDFSGILYIEARKNYTRLVLDEKPTARVLVPLKKGGRPPPRGQFCRIQRGYIVSINKIVSFDNK